MPTLVDLLLPDTSKPLSNEQADVYLRALRHLYSAHLTPDGVPVLTWSRNGQGRFMREGSPVTGDYVKLGSKPIGRLRVAWMLLTGQVLHDGLALFAGKERDMRKWRVIDTKATKSLMAAGRHPNTLPYTDWQGRTHHTPTTKGSA